MNLITIISHDLGRRLGCYGVRNVDTPTLDRFAAENVRFDNAFCVAPQCSPSRAALWTGRYPHANGVVGLAHAGFANDLHPGERHLAQILSEAGYHTCLFGVQHVSPSPGRCGFQEIHGREAGAQGVAEWLASAPDGPFHLQFGLTAPHRPFPHEGFEPADPADVDVPRFLPDIPVVREDLALMDASIRTVDRDVAIVLDGLERSGRADDTIVLFIADHGIPFPRAKMTLYDAGLEIAMLMRVPGLAGPRAIDAMVPNVDVLPSLLELLGMPVPGNLQGRSFVHLLRGVHGETRDAVFAEKTYHTYYDPMRCIRTEKWKLIANFEFAPADETPPDYANNAHGYPEIVLADPPPERYHPAFELYDLEEDPAERNNLANDPSCRETRAALTRRLRAWMQETGDPLLAGPIPQAAYRQRMSAFMGKTA